MNLVVKAIRLLEACVRAKAELLFFGRFSAQKKSGSRRPTRKGHAQKKIRV